MFDFGLTFSDILMTGQNPNSLHENQQPASEAGAVIGANHDGVFQAPDNIQNSFDSLLNFGSNEYHYGLSGFTPSQSSLSVLGAAVLGGPSHASGARPSIVIKMVSPEALDERPIEHRRDVQLKLEISVSANHSPEYCIRVPRTRSVKGSGSRRGRIVLDLELEVLGATTGHPLMSACHTCSIREHPSSASLSMIDFVSKEHLIDVKQGKACIPFRFLCLPGHHGTMDKEYKLSARILGHDQVLEQYPFPNWLRVVSHSHRRRNAPPTTIPPGIETFPVMNPPLNLAGQGGISNTRTFGGSSSGTSAGEHQHSVRVQSLPSPAQIPSVDVSAPVPPENKESELAGQQGVLPTSATPTNEDVAEACPVLSRVNPRRGPTSGGDEIDLIVSNLSPTMKLFARFGCNITATAHIAPGVLFCRLPPAAHPGVVNVTLCQAPSTNAEPYGKSLASFEYEAASKKAVSLLFKLLNGNVLLEFMPLIQRLLQRDAGAPRLEVEPGPLDSNASLHSSLPESAFLDILSALEPLPDFPRLLATANEQGQTLLHLAIHLRYRELVQKLIHWGIDLNVRDVNGFTALHAGHLCDDPLVVGLLEVAGATPFVLDELGRSSTELAASIPSANGNTAGKDGEMIPLVVGHINRSTGQSTLPDRAIPANTQVTACGPAASSETLSMVGCGDLFHSPNPVSITLTTPQAINEQLIHVNPGHAQPLHNQPSLVELPQLSAVLHSSPPVINADREQSLKPTQHNIAHPLRKRKALHNKNKSLRSSPIPMQTRSSSLDGCSPQMQGTPKAAGVNASQAEIWWDARKASPCPTEKYQRAPNRDLPTPVAQALDELLKASRVIIFTTAWLTSLHNGMIDVIQSTSDDSPLWRTFRAFVYAGLFFHLNAILSSLYIMVQGAALLLARRKAMNTSAQESAPYRQIHEPGHTIPRSHVDGWHCVQILEEFGMGKLWRYVAHHMLWSFVLGYTFLLISVIMGLYQGVDGVSRSVMIAFYTAAPFYAVFRFADSL